MFDQDLRSLEFKEGYIRIAGAQGLFQKSYEVRVFRHLLLYYLMNNGTGLAWIVLTLEVSVRVPVALVCKVFKYGVRAFDMCCTSWS